MQGGWQPPPGPGYPPGGGYGAPPPATYGGPPAPYGTPQVPPGAMMPQYGSYEFNDYENSIIDKTASRAKLWGMISTTIGVLQLIGSCGMFVRADLATHLPLGIVAIVVGITFIGAGNSLKAVVTTQGNDLMHLMQALQKISTAFIIESICYIIGFILAVLAILLMMFVFVAVAATR